MKLKLLTTIALLAAALSLSAQIDQIIGEWTTIDDRENIPVSIVKIYQGSNGKYFGRIEKLLVKGYEDMVCEKCEGSLKNRPVQGMIIIRDMEWIDKKLCHGSVLDPENGKNYYGKIWLDPKTGNLILRGSLDKRGFFGRNQEWVRRK